MDLILNHARIVLAEGVHTGSLLVRDGRIADIGSASSLPAAVDLANDWLLPGLVELHTDNLEKHLMPRPKVRWPVMPAILAHDAQVAAAGITTVLDAIGIGDIDHESLRIDTLETSMRLLDEAIAHDLLRADHLLHLRCELAVPNVLELLAPFIHAPRVRLVSLMDHTPGQRQWTDLSHYRTYVTGKKGWSDAKVDTMLGTLQAAQAAYADTHRRHIIDLCRQQHIPLATHDDTTPEHVALAQQEGVSISEFPTTLQAAHAAREAGMGIIMGAPNVVRGGSHSGNVAALTLARAGLLDALSSDYVPASLLHAAFLLTEEAGWSLTDAMKTVSLHPARMVSLDDRGCIAPGLRADLVRVHGAIRHADRVPVVREVWRCGIRIA